MRDPLTISLDKSHIEIGQTLRGRLHISEDLSQCARISLALTSSLSDAAHPTTHSSIALTNGLLEDQDPAPGSLLEFEMDIPLNTPLSFGRQKLFLQADWLEDPKPPAIHKVNIMPDQLSASLFNSLARLGFQHASSSGRLFQAAHGPLSGRLVQIFYLRPLEGVFAPSLDSLEIVFERNTPLGDILFASANRPPFWFAGPGPHLNHYSQATLTNNDLVSEASLSSLISEAQLV